jgi:hypothetical protein
MATSCLYVVFDRKLCLSVTPSFLQFASRRSVDNSRLKQILKDSSSDSLSKQSQSTRILFLSSRNNLFLHHNFKSLMVNGSNRTREGLEFQYG